MGVAFGASIMKPLASGISFAILGIRYPPRLCPIIYISFGSIPGCNLRNSKAETTSSMVSS